MRVLLTIIATLLLVSFAADSSLNVISPHSLSRDFSDGEIDFALSHYGNVPYGTHLTGRLVVIHPVEACSPIERFNKEEEEVIRNPIAVVRRGGCRVAIKTRYAQQAGAKAIIIIDNKDQELTEWFGHEHGAEDIQIPTLLIGKADGDKIVNFDSAASLTHPGYQGIIVSINFSHDKSSSVILDYWYNSADSFGASITFLKEFYSYWQRNNQVIKFRPHIVTWTCAECKKGGFKDDSNNDCVSGGRYCSPDPDDEGPLTGADVVKEDLRQMCVYRQQQKLWWEYTIAVGQECKQEIFECGDRILRKKASSDLYNEVLDCIDNSWEGKKNEKLDNNTILSENKEIQTEYAINHYPVLFINNKPYVGRLPRADKVFEEVCREVDPAPADCNLALARTGEVPLPAETHVGRIIILVVVMLLVAVVCVLYCRRLMKRESKDMSLEVGSMVNRYFSVKDAE